ncbi:3-deoxy-manno-octulosonate cytidylyltransferase (CMP-KDO synthetase) [Leeuwenhoekiella aestuarii]|uniref:3-deoxy-manno-octulosonate cytidylyltransferase n=1 Tax=Leeuwenhoekiella aestuarii TaxID=2249426 RepID=A0A4Q0NZ52_9FLAO|nr:3-deoxy-manno-octulosonate cytidylyltransferase [Leeuwenhoekiella aestuarii]RXG16286.1 3-deoxy-manno-octulosonate cytidylyltransferase (CMP-KDO synthetase) [Leeuwenhoekiella aestuarii]RXG16979.1 3-deoxy-manno-octulosonate cytidylyltransferase (CMP-KDO synthetase) [Leeuwenhoekiella aestuarii]
MTHKLKTIAMIPARYEASRFPGKLMQDLQGKPVIIRTYEAALKTQLFDNVYVVTDSDLIYNTVKAAGGEVIMSQKEHSCGSDRIAEAVADLDIDIVVNVQGDEPFTNEDDMRNVLQVFYENGAEAIDLASLMTPIMVKAEIENPNNVKVIVDEANFALYFSRAPIPFPRDQDIDITYYKHKGIYAFRKQAVLDFAKLPMRGLEAAEKIEAIRYLEYGKRIKMVYSDSPAIGIDTPQDLEEARLIIKKQRRS